VWERIQKIAILTQLSTHLKARHDEGVGTPFPRVPTQLHPGFATKNQAKQTKTPS